MTEEENKDDPSNLIYDLPECFMMTWEELMDRAFTTTTGYEKWNETPKPENNQTSIVDITKAEGGEETLQTPTFRNRKLS